MRCPPTRTSSIPAITTCSWTATSRRIRRCSPPVQGRRMIRGAPRRSGAPTPRMSASQVQFRDDLQLTSAAVYNQAGVYNTGGLQLANAGTNTYIVFGNGSSPSVPAGGTAQPFNGSVNYSGNHTLDDLANKSTVLS